jgi:hypothetical protein
MVHGIEAEIKKEIQVNSFKYENKDLEDNGTIRRLNI